MSSVPLVASLEDLPDAIDFAQKHTSARWFVATRAQVLGQPEVIPAEWALPLAAAVSISDLPSVVIPGDVDEVPTLDEDDEPSNPPVIADASAEVAPGHDPVSLAQGVDAALDQTLALLQGVDLTQLPEPVAQALGLVNAAAMGIDELLDQLGAYDPDDYDDDSDADASWGMLSAATDYDALIAAGYYSDYGVEDAYDDFDIDSEIPLTASGAVPVTAAFTADQRQTYAKQGVALPDGCLSGETLVVVPEGLRAIQDMLGECEVLTDQGWVTAEVRQFGVQELRAVILQSGSEIRTIYATAAHRWYLADGSVKITDSLSVSDMVPQISVVDFPHAEISEACIAAGSDPSRMYELSRSETFERISLSIGRGSYSTGLQNLCDESGQSSTRSIAVNRRTEGTASNAEIVRRVWDNSSAIRLDDEESERRMFALWERGTRSQPKAFGSGSLSQIWSRTRTALRILQSAIGLGRGDWDSSNSRLLGWHVIGIATTDRIEPVYCAIVPRLHRFTLADGILTGNSYPIPNKRYLKKAIRAIGRSKHSASTVRKHIVKRAKALGATGMLPDSYKPMTAALADIRESAKDRMRERVNRGKALSASAESLQALVAGRHSALEDVEHGFDEALHPRGRDGKFITKGGRVVIHHPSGSNVEGTVQSVDSHGISVKTDAGSVEHVQAHDLSNAPTAEAHLGQHAAPEGTRASRLPKPTSTRFISRERINQPGVHDVLDTHKANQVVHTSGRNRAYAERDKFNRAEDARTSNNGGMAQTKERPLEYSHTETSGRHEGMAVYKPSGTPSQGYKIPPRPESLTPGHTPAKVESMTTVDSLRARRDAAKASYNPHAAESEPLSSKSTAEVHDLAENHPNPAVRTAAKDELKSNDRARRDASITKMQEAAQDRTRRISNANVAKDELRARRDANVGKGKGKVVLERTLPNGQVKSHGTPMTHREAAQAAMYSLHDNGVANRSEATKFASKVEDAKVGETVEHPSGYKFRKVAAESASTSDAKQALRDKVAVYNVKTGKVEHVSQAEATAGHIRYGQSLGAGSPAAGQTIKNALNQSAEQRTEHAVEMYGSDRSKWSITNLRSAAKEGDTQAAAALKVKLRAKASPGKA